MLNGVVGECPLDVGEDGVGEFDGADDFVGADVGAVRGKGRFCSHGEAPPSHGGVFPLVELAEELPFPGGKAMELCLAGGDDGTSVLGVVMRFSTAFN